MDKKEFSKNDVSIIKKSESIDENQLEEIAGGTSNAPAPCVCDCWAGNSNNSEKAELSSAVN